MRALTFQGIRTVRVESVADPRIESPTEAIVRVALAGICGSDLHPYHGRETGLDPGTVMGHEFVGEIVEIGAEVRSLRTGTRVASPFSTSCGRCAPCREGLTSRCAEGRLFGWVEKGEGLPGGQAGYVRVPMADSTLFPLPSDLSDAEGLLAGDVLATGLFGARLAGAGPGRVTAVVGCGPVGLMTVAAAAEPGAGSVFAIETVAERLALAGRLGARTVDASREDPVTAILDATDGRGADGVVEAVGSAQAGRVAFETVRAGGVLAVVGVHTRRTLPFTPSEAYGRNLTFRTGRCPARALMDEVVPILRSRGRDLASVISHELPLEDGPRGYRMFDRKEEGCTKVVLKPR